MGKVWSSNITVGTGQDGPGFVHICSTTDAANYLLDTWPAKHSETYRAAIRFCAKALKGEVSHEAAYISLMAALRDAKIAIVVDRRRVDCDELELGMQHAFAEGVLADLG